MTVLEALSSYQRIQIHLMVKLLRHEEMVLHLTLSPTFKKRKIEPFQQIHTLIVTLISTTVTSDHHHELTHNNKSHKQKQPRKKLE